MLCYKQLTENKRVKNDLLYCVLKSNAKHFFTKSYDADFSKIINSIFYSILCVCNPTFLIFNLKNGLHDY